MRVTSQELHSKAKLQHKLHPATQETELHRGRKSARPRLLLGLGFGASGRHQRGPFRAPLDVPHPHTSFRRNHISAGNFLSLNVLLTTPPDHLQVSVLLGRPTAAGFTPSEVPGTSPGPPADQVPARELGPRRGQLLHKRQETSAQCGETESQRCQHGRGCQNARGNTH